MENDEYFIPLAAATSEIDVKKSRFIANAFGVTSRDSAKNHISGIKKAFPDARHHCWAYVVGTPDNPVASAFSDDGEPNGTAGKPILSVIQHKNVGDILVVISRYFGGIKLGAGGLVRAYSSATQKVYEKLNTTLKSVLVEVDIEASYSFEQPLRYWLSTHGGEFQNAIYKEKVMFTIRFPPALKPQLITLLSRNSCTLLKIRV